MSKIKKIHEFRIFSNLSPYELEIMENIFISREYSTGSDIYSPGEESENLYILYSGEIIITHTLDEDVITLARIKPGYFFGEAGIISSKQKHQTRAKASYDSFVIILGRNKFLELGKTNPEIALKFLSNITSVLSERMDEDATRIGILSAISVLTGNKNLLENIKDLASEILRITLKAIPAHHAFLGIFQNHGPERINILASSGISPKELPNDFPVDSDPYISELANGKEEILLASEYYKKNEKVFYAKRNLIERSVKIEGNNIGVLAIADKKEGEFTEQNSIILQIISTHIAFALQEARIREEKKAREELKREYIRM